ncbi:CPBP family intramembrane metalloprotease [Candidatus Micrarchaeota archaeon]|nr:CPBP family intramembrane metalloprotease [Candidatus Micrarchaeota archaeon]
MNAKQFFLLLLVFSLIGFVILVLFFRDNYLYDGALHLGMFSLALYGLWDKNLKTTLKKIGVPGEIKTNILYFTGGLIALFTILFILGVVAMVAGFNDQSKVVDKIGALPWYILALAIFLAPVTEELLFRAFLVPRIGILFSALVFGIVHFSYGSIVEIVGVTAVGLLFGFIFKKSKSIIPTIAIHMVYNLLSIAIVKGGL